MGLNAVQQHIQGLLDNLVIPSYPMPLRAYVAPPVPDDLAVGPLCYIWASRTIERRLSLPRSQNVALSTGATKEAIHYLDVFLYAMEDPNSPGVDQRFPVFVDTVTATLRTAPIGIQVTDPTTNAVSSILAIAEEVTTNYDFQRSLADQRYVRYAALLSVRVDETFQG